MTPLELPSRLRVTRNLLGKTQRQVADDIGITKLTVVRIERYNQIPRPNTVALIETWIERNTEHLTGD